MCQHYHGGCDYYMHRSTASDYCKMSHSAPNSRANSPSSTKHGGHRPGGGKKSSKRRNCQQSSALGAAAFVLNNQHRQHLSECISSLSNSSGRSLSSNELRIIIRIAMWLQVHNDYTEAAAIDSASIWAGSSHHTIISAYRHYLSTHELLEPDASNRGSGNPTHPLHNTSLTFEQILSIQQLLTDSKISNQYLPAKKLKKQLNLNLSDRHLRRVLRKLGYRWRRKRCMGRMNKEQRADRTRSYIKQYSDALKEQELGSAIIVYMDESYIHTLHQFQFCWALISDQEGYHVRGSPAKGKRLIIIHAMCKDGLLHINQRGRNVQSLTNDVSEPYPSCEFIFEAALDSEDYHKNMNSTVFMQWIRNRLIPTFQRKYGRKMKMILVLDNARYHHPHDEHWINPNQMNKDELAAWIASNPRGENGITIIRDGREKYFGRTALFQHGSKYAPTVAEMKLWVQIIHRST